MSAQATAEQTDALEGVFTSEVAFDAWYEAALPRVYGYVFSRCGRDPDLAEDLTQLAFVDAVRQWRSFEGRSDPVTWVCAIARHKIADHYRHLESEARRQLHLVEDARDRASGPDTTEPASLGEREAIAAALATLPPLHRAVLVFTALDGLSVRETATLIGRSEKATESLLGRARAGFRRAYAQEGGSNDG